MTLAARVRDALHACGVGPDDRLLVAASGGVDSTVLLRTLAEIGHPLVAAHVDHGLRPDSEEDGAFAEALAAELGVPTLRLVVTVGEGNVQAEARRARYAALAEAARQHACVAVVTGHTATDQAETVLMALARGAGLRGLAGMPAQRVLAGEIHLIRPLLQISRLHVEAEAQARGWAWREDPSNATGRYRRNRLRRDVLPLLREETGPEADVRIAASAGAARAALGLVDARLDALSDGPGRVNVGGLRRLARDLRQAVLAEAVAAWAPDAVRTRVLVERLDLLVGAEVGACVDAGGVRVWRERESLRFEAQKPAPLGGHLVVTPLPAVPARFDAGPEVEVVDADRAEGRLEVRGWSEGDRIRPLGLDGSRLVSDLLRERGVPRADRGDVPVVFVDGEVAWVVGHRLAAGVAVHPGTRRAARWAWHRGAETG